MRERHALPEGASEEAARRIAGRVVRTPLLSSRTAARMIAEATGTALAPGPFPDEVPRLFVKA